MSKFKEIGVAKDLCKGINEMGFINPTEVQEQSIPFLLLENRDLISLAQTGTGKTAAFGLPVIQKTELKNKYVQSIILCPTRELCIQICKDLLDEGAYLLIHDPKVKESQIETDLEKVPINVKK